jgi:hypothetical protein
MVGRALAMDVWMDGFVRNGYEMVENMCCGDVCSGTKRR